MVLRLKTKLVALIGGGTALVVLATVLFQYSYSRAQEIRELRSESDTFCQLCAQEFGAPFQEAATVSRMLALQLGSAPKIDRDLLQHDLKGATEENPSLYGVFACFKPDFFGPGTGRHGPYYHRKDDETVYSAIAYDYTTWEYYRVACESRQPHWTEPYFGPAGGAAMVTHSVPILRGGECVGIVGADLSLASLSDKTRKLHVADSGYAFITTRTGAYVSFPDPAREFKGNLFEWNRELAEQITAGSGGFLEVRGPLRGEHAWLVYRPIPETPLVMAVVYPESEVLADVLALGRLTLLLAGAGLLILLALVVLIAGSLTRPLSALVGAEQRVAAGNLDEHLDPDCRTWEICELTQVFNKMTADLRAYIENLRATTAAKERIESELQVARNIQTSILPRTFPPFPHRPELDIYALMDPAREVGGDFYDFFFIDDQHLCFLIGDVSDKGVPAALFMMVTKTLLRREAAAVGQPQDILFRVNNLLVPDNDAAMFVTIFCAVLDTRTGELCYATAGHNPPLLHRRGAAPRYLDVSPGFVAGGMPDSPYEQECLTLSPGDILLLYTDGVTEARDPSGQLFAEARLEECLAAESSGQVTDVIRRIRSRVEEFASGQPQSDDIALLAVRFNGGVQAPPPQGQ